MARNASTLSGDTSPVVPAVVRAHWPFALPRAAKSAWVFLRSPSLARRSMAFSVLGLTLSLALLGMVTLWTVDDITQQEYRERLDLATATASHVDRALDQSLHTLGLAAEQLSIPLTQEQTLNLDGLALQLGRATRFEVTDPRGAVVWQDSRLPPLGSAALTTNSQLIQSALSTAHNQVGPCESQDGDPPGVLVCMAVPVHDENDTLSGVLLARFDPRDSTLGLLPFTDLGSEMQVSLVDGGGGGSADEDMHPAVLADLIASRTPGLRIHPGAGNVSTHITAFAPILAASDMGVVVEQPRDIALGASRQLELRFGLVALILLILGAAAVWWEVRRVSGPLGRLTVAADRFAAGQLDERVQMEATGELGGLANAFEQMRQRLRDSLTELAGWNRELEGRVASRTSQLEQRNRELANINTIADTLSRSLSVQVILEQTLTQVIEITGAGMACFHLAWEPSARPTLVAERNMPTALQEGALSQIDSLCARAIHRDRVAFLEGSDLQVELPICQAAGVRSCVIVPVRAEPEPQGVLLLGSAKPGVFDELESSTLAAIGRQVGMALANAHLYERLHVREQERSELLQRAIAGQEDERRRLAQELHDQTSQTLASLQLGLDQLAERSREPEVRQHASELQHIASAALADVHRLAIELRPSVLDDVGLGAALERYIGEVRHRFAIPLEFASVGMDGVRLAAAPATVIYRVVQAAVTNAMQHAHAHQISVLLQRRGQDVVVVVEDDGRGFDLQAVQASPLEERLGLAGMQERASLVHATLTLETEPGAGTTVFLKVPIDGNTVKEEDAENAPSGSG
jgi:signal transduction histidine kinase